MWVSRYFVWFLVYSCMGWIYETIYCTIKNKKWANRGFLYGPICPIYGVGALAISVIVEYANAEGFSDFTWQQVFLISFFGSMVLEYVTSWALEKLFHAYWWDYSNMPFNINGRICLPASILFGLAGLLVVYKIYPFMQHWTAHVSVIGMEVFSLIAMAVFESDLTFTVSALTNFAKELQILADGINQHMEGFVDSLEERKTGAEERFSQERERFSRTRAISIAENMTGLRRSTLRRVKGFGPEYSGKGREHLERVISEIKEFRVRKK